MSETVESPSLQEASAKLTAIPITSGTLGRKIGLARSTLDIVDERFVIGRDTLDDACFALFLSYFAHKHNYDFDDTRTFAHVQSLVGGEFATEHGLESGSYWPLRERAEDIDRPFEVLWGLGYIDDRYHNPNTWPNPIVSLGRVAQLG